MEVLPEAALPEEVMEALPEEVIEALPEEVMEALEELPAEGVALPDGHEVVIVNYSQHIAGSGQEDLGPEL
ncbi:unnamed protein product [Alternaria alternata]